MLIFPELTPDRLFMMDERGKAWNTHEREIDKIRDRFATAEEEKLTPYISDAKTILREMSYLPASRREKRLAYLLQRLVERET